MKNMKQIMTISVVIFVVLLARQQLWAAPVYYSGNGSYYELLDSQATWSDANTAASALSYAGRTGHLVTITSVEENQFILDTFSPHQIPYGFWMGANDVAVEGEWRWVTGPETGTLFSLGRTSVGYTFWGSNEPTNWNGIEHFLVFDAEGGSGLPEWDDKPFDYTQNYLVEYSVPEPGLLEGDANRDGVVSAADYAAIQGFFGQVGDPGIPGDANGDGVVSAGDYASVQANFGNTAPTMTIPEPATMSLLVIGGLALIRRKC
jgi:hypothetical protein